jgi:hypothetical protein
MARLPSLASSIVIRSVQILGGDWTRLGLSKPHAQAAAIFGDKLDARRFEGGNDLRNRVGSAADLAYYSVWHYRFAGLGL